MTGFVDFRELKQGVNRFVHRVNDVCHSLWSDIYILLFDRRTLIDLDKYLLAFARRCLALAG
jgi:hypothetical protein